MPARTFDEPGATPYIVHGAETPDALVVFGTSSDASITRKAGDLAQRLTATTPTLAVAVPTAVVEAPEGDYVRPFQAANGLRAGYDRDLLFGLVSPAEVQPFELMGLPSVHGVYTLDRLGADGRERSLVNLPRLADFTDALPKDGNELVRRLAAARDAQNRPVPWSGLISDLCVAVDSDETLPRPAELPPGVVWANRPAAGLTLSERIAVPRPGDIIELARAMSEFSVQGLVTDGRQITGAYTNGVPANSQVTQLMVGPQDPDVRFGLMAFDGISHNIRAAATVDTAVVRPLGPLKGWETEFGATLGTALPYGAEQTLLVTPSESCESQAALVIDGLLAERPDYRGRVGLMIEQPRFSTSLGLKLLDQLRRACADGDVTLLYHSDQTANLADAHDRIARGESRWPELSQGKPLKTAMGLARARGGVVSRRRAGGLPR